MNHMLAHDRDPDLMGGCTEEAQQHCEVHGLHVRLEEQPAQPHNPVAKPSLSDLG